MCKKYVCVRLPNPVKREKKTTIYKSNGYKNPLVLLAHTHTPTTPPKSNSPIPDDRQMDDDVRYSYEMDDNRFDDFNNNSYPDSDLQQTQSTQQASQQSAPENNDSHLWGYLQPCSGGLTRIDFWKIHPCYTIGRNTEFNSVVFPGFKISQLHPSLLFLFFFF